MGVFTGGLSVQKREKKRGSNDSDLGKLVEDRRTVRVRSENIGIIGAENTGRNTLVRRFMHMAEGPFEAPEDRKYTRRSILIDLSERPSIYSNETVELDFFILNARSRDYNTFSRNIPHLKSIALVFDVGLTRTVNIATSCMIRIRQLVAEPPRFIIIGNKMDLQLSSTEMRYVRRQARDCGAEKYYECSARQNTDMDKVLDAILCITFFPSMLLPE